MGGRSSYPTKKFLGEGKEVVKSVKDLKEHIGNKEIEQVSSEALNLFVKSRKPITYSSYSNKFFPAVVKNFERWREIKDLNLLRREISKAWSKTKKANEIFIPKEVDRIIVENTLKIVGGKK